MFNILFFVFYRFKSLFSISTLDYFFSVTLFI